jgi:hypothetical protein
MKFEKLMASAVSAAAIIVIAIAPAALAKGKPGKQATSFSVGCLTQDTALLTAEGFEPGSAPATVTITPASLWPPNHKLTSEDLTMTLVADVPSDVDVSLQVTDITDDQLAGESGGGDGCGQPTSKQGADWAPTTFPGPLATGSLELITDSLPLDGTQLRSERCAKLGTRTYTVTVQCCDTTNAVCDTVGTVNSITLDSLPVLDVTVAKSKKH